MLKRSLDTTLAGLVLAVSIPFLVLSAILAALRSEWRSAHRRILIRQDWRRSEFKEPRFMVDDFGFDRAIEAYESLIDATIAERQG